MKDALATVDGRSQEALALPFVYLLGGDHCVCAHLQNLQCEAG